MPLEDATSLDRSQFPSASKPNREVPSSAAGEHGQLLHVVFRAVAFPDGRSNCTYQVPGKGLLGPAEFNVWLTNNCAITKGRPAVAVLVIREFRDLSGILQGCTMERRYNSADGAYFGDPARVEIAGSAERVHAWRVTADGGMEESAAAMAEPADPLPRGGLFAGEERELRAVFGEGTRILTARGATALEDLAGFSTIVRFRTHDGRERTCAIGWHGTRPFLLEGEFPCIGEAIDRHELSNPDQAAWLRYAERYEDRIILEVRPNGTSDDVLVLTGDANGGAVWHLIDADGVELWCKAADNLADSPCGKANDDPPPSATVGWQARRA